MLVAKFLYMYDVKQLTILEQHAIMIENEIIYTFVENILTSRLENPSKG